MAGQRFQSLREGGGFSESHLTDRLLAEGPRSSRRLPNLVGGSFELLAHRLHAFFISRTAASRRLFSEGGAIPTCRAAFRAAVSLRSPPAIREPIRIKPSSGRLRSGVELPPALSSFARHHVLPPRHNHDPSIGTTSISGSEGEPAVENSLCALQHGSRFSRVPPSFRSAWGRWTFKPESPGVLGSSEPGKASSTSR